LSNTCIQRRHHHSCATACSSPLSSFQAQLHQIKKSSNSGASIIKQLKGDRKHAYHMFKLLVIHWTHKNISL
jgi:hypothetical protein